MKRCSRIITFSNYIYIWKKIWLVKEMNDVHELFFLLLLLSNMWDIDWSDLYFISISIWIHKRIIVKYFVFTYFSLKNAIWFLSINWWWITFHCVVSCISFLILINALLINMIVFIHQARSIIDLFVYFMCLCLFLFITNKHLIYKSFIC